MSDRAREGAEQALLEIMAARHPGVAWRVKRPKGDAMPPSRKVMRPVIPACHGESPERSRPSA